MLPTAPDAYRIALNRVTFGARDTDVANVHSWGWSVWVDDQLSVPKGDDDALAAHLARQAMRIRYAAPAENDTRGTWQAVDEMRPLNYIRADIPALWHITRNTGTLFSSSERFRIRQELAAATWMRNAHSRYQLREFMADFWHNHFNIGKNDNELATALLPIFDRDVIRANALGNFRALLEATATAGSMLIYLDNYVSGATAPNENYAREIMELHTLGSAAYLGTVNPATVERAANGVAVGFTDQDVIQASRALSGWSLLYGQRGENNVVLGNTGEFFFNARQHNRNAGSILGVSLAGVSNDMAQGRRLLDILAAHPATAVHIVGKLARRIFGDTPPQTIIDRGIAAWNTYQAAPDQIAKVLRSMLVDGTEVMTAPVAKVRRPYERIIALARTAFLQVNAATFMTSVLDGLHDGLFAWPAPNGRPDASPYWLATGSTLATWNLLFQVPNYTEFSGNPLSNQTPLEAMNSATTVVEYWVGRMIGHHLGDAAMNTLVSDQASNNGIPAATRQRNNTQTRIEQAHRRLVSLIATTEEFTLR
jgi:uncharacterized protein (DUF1800 family)